MALLLHFSPRAPSADRTIPTFAGAAEIIILPCIRRERMEEMPAPYTGCTHALPAQRQA
jgi:hypothetical protein